MHEQLGDRLAQHINSCKESCLLVAPFMKSVAVARLLDCVDGDVELVLVTRWRLLEIAQGVSDLQVLDLVEKRPNTALRLCDNLHAKYYRMDSEGALIGSANLTATGLGWSKQSNLEVLTWNSMGQALRKFESDLLECSYPATRVYAGALQAAADAVSATRQAADVGDPEDDATIRQTISVWLPKTRNPPDLFRAYRGDEPELTAAARRSTADDLQALQIPRGLDKSGFEDCVRARMLSAAVIRDIDAFVSSSRRFGAVRDFLRDHPALVATSFDASYAWQTSFRWLLYFLPERYKAWTTNYSEVIQRRAD